MTLKMILDKYSDEEIIAKMTEKCDVPNKLVMKYFDVLYYLRNLKSKESELHLLIVPQREYGEEDNYYVGVFGYRFEKNEHYAIDFVPWFEWLGMNVLEGSLKMFNQLDILVYCIFSMTELGLTEEKIQKEKKTLEEISERLENGTEETYTMEEVMEHIRDKFDFEVSIPSEEDREKRENQTLKTMEYNKKTIKEILKGSFKNG